MAACHLIRRVQRRDIKFHVFGAVEFPPPRLGKGIRGDEADGGNGRRQYIASLFAVGDGLRTLASEDN